MKKLTKKLVMLTFFGLSACAVNAQTWNIGTPTATDVTATLSGGTLTINGTGTGKMQNFTWQNTPWYRVHGSITSLVINAGVTTIGDLAFLDCSNITGTLNIPYSVTAIGSSAFANCSGFTGALNIPNSVTSLGGSAFYGCSGFTGTLTIPSLVTSIDGTTFYLCSGLTGTLTIPNLVTSIGSQAFIGCKSFSSMLIPASVTSIATNAFYGCAGLTSITCLNPDPTTITMGSNVFVGVNTGTCVLKVPTGSYSAYHTAPQWSDFTNIQETATGIENVYLQNLKIYPNPVKDELRIESGELIIEKVEICDLTGKTIYQFDNLKNKINVSALAQGIYIVKLKTDKGTVTEKFIKE